MAFIIEGLPYLIPISILPLVYFFNLLTNFIVLTSNGDPSSVHTPSYLSLILEGLKGNTIRFKTIQRNTTET